MHPIARNPIYQPLSVTDFDPDAFLEVIRGGRFEHEVVDARSLDATLERIEGSDVLVDCGSYGFGTIVRGDFDPDRICFGAAGGGEGPTRINGQDVAWNDVQYYAEGEELLYRAGPGTRWMAVQIDRAVLERSAAERTERPVELDAMGRNQNLRLTPMSVRRLHRCVASVLDDARRPNLPEGQTGLQSLVDTLVDVVTDVDDRQPTTVRAGESARRRLVDRAIRLVRACPTEPYDSQSICRPLGVSERSLQLAFRQCLGMSPSRYLLTVRLNRVHRELMGARPGGRRVNDIAVEHGFTHLGRFAQQYRACFLRRPSESLRATPPAGRTKSPDA